MQQGSLHTKSQNWNKIIPCFGSQYCKHKVKSWLGLRELKIIDET